MARRRNDDKRRFHERVPPSDSLAPRDLTGAAPNGERIAKVIARAGLCSRRDAEQWIAAGRVSVNGTVIATPALNVSVGDRITVDGNPLPQPERTRVFLYHKPAGLVTTNDDPQGRPTIFDALPQDLPRLLTIGRLDIGTEGLLLLTNDGGLARVLELPQTGWLRRYRVRAYGQVTQPQLDRLRAGMTVDGIHYGPIEATLDPAHGTSGSNVWLTFAIREGKNREVRNVLGALGLQVSRLIRVSFGPFQLGELPAGAVEEVKTRALREQLGEDIARSAGCDFSAPVITPAAAHHPARMPARPDDRASDSGRERPPTANDSKERTPSHRHHRAQDQRQRSKRPPFDDRPSPKPKRKPKSGPLWRDFDAPGRRTFRGSRRDAGHPFGEDRPDKRAGLLTDRKGRRVLVERFGTAASGEPPSSPPRGRKHRGRPHRRDRAGGPRPSRPKER
jgi:23S rRNA pseudouridine2605 synthase